MDYTSFQSMWAKQMWVCSWQATLLFAVVAGLTFVFRHQIAPRWQFWLWTMVLLRLISAPLAPQTSISLFNLFDTTGESVRVESSAVTNLEFSSQLAGPTRPQADLVVPPEPPGLSMIREAGGPLAVAFSPSRDWLLPVWSLLFVCWLGGVTVLMLHLLASFVRTRQLLRRATAATGTVLRANLADCCQKLRLARLPGLRVLPCGDSPFVSGIFRPKIYLPESVLETLTDEQVSAVLLHEVAHIKRQDVAVELLTLIIRNLYWFHPVVWITAARLRRNREAACDDIAVAATGTAQNYAEVLIQLATLNRRQVAVGVCPMASSYKAMVYRIERLASERPKSRWSGISGCAALVFVALTGLTNSATSPVFMQSVSTASQDDFDVPTTGTYYRVQDVRAPARWYGLMVDRNDAATSNAKRFAVPTVMIDFEDTVGMTKDAIDPRWHPRVMRYVAGQDDAFTPTTSSEIGVCFRNLGYGTELDGLVVESHLGNNYLRSGEFQRSVMIQGTIGKRNTIDLHSFLLKRRNTDAVCEVWANYDSFGQQKRVLVRRAEVTEALPQKVLRGLQIFGARSVELKFPNAYAHLDNFVVGSQTPGDIRPDEVVWAAETGVLKRELFSNPVGVGIPAGMTLALDLKRLKENQGLSRGDFEFVRRASGADGVDTLSGPEPDSITLLRGVGVMGADRVLLRWAENAIEKRGAIRVTLNPSRNPALPATEDMYLVAFDEPVGDGNQSPVKNLTRLPNNERVPYANPDLVEAPVNPKGLAINVITNDKDGDSIVASSAITPPGAGSAVIKDGLVLYTPPKGWLGTDPLVTQVTDGRGGFDVATTNVSVIWDSKSPAILLGPHQTQFKKGEILHLNLESFRFKADEISVTWGDGRSDTYRRKQ